MKRSDDVSFYTISEGETLGEIEILDNTLRTCFAQAKETSLLLICKKDIFLDLLADYPLIEEKVRLDMQTKKKKIGISKSTKMRKTETGFTK